MCVIFGVGRSTFNYSKNMEDELEIHQPTDEEYLTKSVEYITKVVYDINPKVPLKMIAESAYQNLNLFKTVVYDLYFRDNANTTKNTKLCNNIVLKKSNKNKDQVPKNSKEYQDFVKIYSQQLREQATPPRQRLETINEKWNSMSISKIREFIKTNSIKEQDGEE